MTAATLANEAPFYAKGLNIHDLVNRSPHLQVNHPWMGDLEEGVAWAHFLGQFENTWDLAMHFHEIKKTRRFQKLLPHLRKLSIQAIVQQAKKMRLPDFHVKTQHIARFQEVPVEAESVDIDLDETIQQMLLPSSDDSLWMEYELIKKRSLVVCIDTSLSMNGEKCVWTAVALACLMLAYDQDIFSVITFENEVTLLKDFNEALSLKGLLERFLNVPAEGYTHLECGVQSALQMVKRIQRTYSIRQCPVVLLTDGKYTAGKNPSYLAPYFPELNVFYTSSQDHSGQPLCETLAQKGNGTFYSIEQVQQLPLAMYDLVKHFKKHLRTYSVA